MDRGCRRDPHQTGAQTEDGSAGCATAVDVAGGRSFSPDLGAERRKRGSAAAALASASAGANAHAHHEQLHVLALNEGVRRKKAAAMRTSHCPAEGATTWPRTRTVRGNTPAISSATTRNPKPDLNEWVRAA